MRLFVIVTFLRENAASRFKRSNWPLHLTLLGNFCSDLVNNDLKGLLEKVSNQTAQFSVQGKSREQFGANNDVSVVEMEHRKELMDLHNHLVSSLGDSIDIKSPEYNGKGFRPHVTDQLGVRIEPGEMVTIDSMSLVELDSDTAEVCARFSL